MSFWFKHPRSGKKDTMLTLATLAVLAVLGKFLLNGVSLEVLGKIIKFGTVDAGLIAAILTPTLGAYVGRKITSNPDSFEQEKK